MDLEPTWTCPQSGAGRAGGGLAPRAWLWTAAAAVVVAVTLCGCSRATGPESYVENLGHSNDDTRKTARDELIRMGEDAVPALVETFASEPSTEEGLRRLAGIVDVLSSVKTIEGLRVVGKRVEDPDARVRLIAIRGVANLAGVRKGLGVERLRVAMSDADPACVRAAAMGLMTLAFEDATAVLEDFLERGEGVAAVYAAEGLYRLDGRDAAALFLLDSLSSGDEAMRAAAETAAVGLGDRFVEPLIRYAAERPGARGPEAVLNKIRDALLAELDKRLDPRRVEDILKALGRIGDEASCDRLLEIVTKGQIDVGAQVAAAEALGDAATSSRPAGAQEELRRRIHDSLKEVLHARRGENKVRIACAISLCRLGDAEGVEYLLAQLGSLEQAKQEDRAVTGLRIRAQEALTSSGAFVVPYLIRVLENPETGETTCWAAASTLGALRVKEAAPYLGRFLTATVSPALVKPREGDPVLEMSLRGRRRNYLLTLPPQLGQEAALMRMFATLVCFFVLSGVALLLVRASGRTSVSWPAALIGSLAFALVSLGIGLAYRNGVLGYYAPWYGTGGVFAPTRKTVLKSLFGDQPVIPRYDPSLRIAAAFALGRIGSEEGARWLQQGLDIHENLRTQLSTFAEHRRYHDLVPAEVPADEKLKARDTLRELCQSVIHEQERVLFYIRLALKGIRQRGYEVGGSEPAGRSRRSTGS